MTTLDVQPSIGQTQRTGTGFGRNTAKPSRRRCVQSSWRADGSPLGLALETPSR